MRSSLRLLLCAATAVFFVTACSSTTVVSSEERATDSASTELEQDDSVIDDDAENDDPADTSTSDDDEDDGDRGERDDTSTPRSVDIAEGFGLGGAEQLASLLTDCNDGNDLACDILFQISAFDSPEEEAALTCGGRSDVDVVFCTDGIDAGEDELVFDPDSDALPRVIEACEAEGNMTACDFLYYRSPLDSEFQEIGGTCGGRVNVAIPDCRSMTDE